MNITYQRMKKIILFMLMLIAVSSPLNVQAASQKTKALKAYDKFLSQKTIKWNDYYTAIPAKNCRFLIAYIDNDKIPELVLCCTDVTHAASFGRLYMYKAGKVKLVRKIDLDTGYFKYYKKKGIFVGEYVMGGVTQSYYKFNKGKPQHKLTKENRDEVTRKYTLYYNSKQEITKQEFNKNLKKLVGSTKCTKAKLYKNTAKNRKKYLK